MAQLGVAGAGAVIGGVIGTFAGGNTMLGAQIGWAIGGVAGALLFPPKGQDQAGPRLNDLSVQTSGFGLPIPVVAGRAKLAGNVIWSTGLREQVTTRRQGKGGGGPKVTSYSYFGSWAVGLCEWLLPANNPGVLRIWLDTKLVYDTTGATDVVAIPGLVWRFYPGSETQLPDPLIEATVGAANAPAHRGLAYIVFDDVPLDRFGNRIPSVTVELADSIVSSFPEVAATPPAEPLWPSKSSERLYQFTLAGPVALDYARGRIYEGRSRTTGASGTVADEMIRVYDLATLETIGEYQYDEVIGPLLSSAMTSPSLQGNGCGLMHVGADGFLYVAGGNSTRVPIFKINPDTMTAVAAFGASLAGAGATFIDPRHLYLNAPVMLTTVQVQRLMATPRTFLCGVGNNAGAYIIDADFMQYVWGHSGCLDPNPLPGTGALVNGHLTKLVPGLQDIDGSDLWHIRTTSPAPTITITRVKIASGAQSLTNDTAMGLRVTQEDVIDIVSELDAGATSARMMGAFWDATDDSLVITIAGSGSVVGSYGRFTTFKWQSGSILWSVVNHAGGSRDDARGEPGRVLSGLWARGNNLVLQPGTGDVLTNAAGAPWSQTLAWLDEQRAILGWKTNADRVITKRYMTRAAANVLTVGTVVQALCTRSGMTLSEINTSALTDSLRGYLLARPMSARDAITPLAAYVQFDAVEVDDVLLFRKRAGAVVATVPYADMVRETPNESVIEEQRAQDVELPREITVRYADIERGWEQNAQSWRRPISPTATMQSRVASGLDLPMPLTAAEAKAVARRFCVATWRERTRVSFSAPPEYLRLVPTDPINVGTRDGATIRCRILSTQLGANWVTRVEAVTEDAAIYGLASDADGGSGWQEPQMPLPYSTRLIVPDLALIEDGDDRGQAGLREYAFACAYSGARFRGVTVIERGPGLPWEQIGVVTTPVEWGGLIATPPAPATPWTWDETGSLRVRMTNGAPESATDLEVLNGANRAALVAPDGSAEIVQWRTATQETDGTWTLTGLLRGRRGTEDLIGSRRSGNAFIILDGTRLLYDAAVSETAAVRQLKAVSIFQTQDTAPGPIVKTARGRAEKPYAPAQIRGTRDGGLNLTIAWQRRTRVGGEWLDGTGAVLLSEGAEAYEVEIMSGSTVVRTIAPLSSPSTTYLASQQVTDFGSAQASVRVRVYQISSIVGRGIAAEAIV